MTIRLQTLAACIVLTCIVATPARPGDSQAGFRVSTRVIARVWIERVEEPETFVLTMADVERGYKLLDLRYRVHAFGTPRYLLNIAPCSDLAERIHIEGLGTPVSLGSTEITVMQQATTAVNDLRLRLRVELSSGLPAGNYAMPVFLSVSVS